MSRVRIHNFSISLDGFATGEGQALDTPFGHAGHRLHEWMFATRFGRREVLGEQGIDVPPPRARMATSAIDRSSAMPEAITALACRAAKVRGSAPRGARK